MYMVHFVELLEQTMKSQFFPCPALLQSTSHIASNQAKRKHGLASNSTTERVRQRHKAGGRHRTRSEAARERGT